MPNRFVWRSLIALSMCATLSSTGLTQGRRNAPVTLPDGPGKEIVQNVCGQCHGLGMVTNDGYSREEWPRIFGTMLDLPEQQGWSASIGKRRNFRRGRFLEGRRRAQHDADE